ncbi:hypothetical protein [Mucilaginibacter psychrotolerans]|uniref:Uncharacterized protein n=1 Tax=Mucilaginibacter psychrotolerans TaxID=1524096 RepID=A0A4Y8S5Q5_9SPHI|nr:hypothetical protein [Mucilaginibacter psychrotolerans]TFF33935.1 hypothetical protein E2R66_23950 [Mucilaginibacter psychrotolerans]
MKKFLLIACCAVCMMACKRTTNTDTNKPGPTVTTLEHDNIGKTLNGLDSADAIKLVTTFKNDTTSKDRFTNIWFSKSFVEDTYDILSSQTDADGIRLYIGKNADGHNTLVVMSTKDGGNYTDPDSSKIPPSKKIHVDYFQHGYPILNTKEVKNQDSYTATLGDGADLYQDTTNKPCPKIKCEINESQVSCIQAKTWAQGFKGGAIDIRSVWYSLKLIAYLKEQIHAGVSNRRSVDGIRIYFVVDTTRRKNGFLLTPTEEINGVHQDIYDCYSLHKMFDVVDHGEECPIFCKGTM